MQHDPKCPICSAQDWLDLGERSYHKPDRYTGTQQYKRAMEVLFEVWAPEQKVFNVKFIACRHCGFLSYCPRPSSEDVSRKYSQRPPSAEQSETSAPQPVTRADVRRQRRLAKIIRSESGDRSTESLRVLDFGGGDGRMLAGLVAKGATCHLVDYSKTVHSGVAKIGNTENDIPEDAAYDAIVCSHVVEHLADPRTTLEALRKSLAPNGIMYIEVPIEVVGDLPAREQPVTHVNFFTPESLRVLLELSGYNVRWCRLVAEPHRWGYKQLCAGALVTLGSDSSREVSMPGVKTLQSYLKGSFPVRLQRRWVLGLETPDFVRQHMRKLPYLWRFS